MLWLHARGYRGAWDAPVAYRRTMLEEEDPPPAMFVAPPAREAVSDHDVLLQLRAAYAAQTQVLDECVAAALAAIEDFELQSSTAIVLVGARGFALGEHGMVGAKVEALYGELLHVPCLVRVPGGEAPLPRGSKLMQPSDIRNLITSAVSRVIESPAEHGASGKPLPGALEREYVVARGRQGERAIRTAAWMLRRPPTGPAEGSDAGEGAAPETAELYLKPDDRWEANEIASRMPEERDRLLAILELADQGAAEAVRKQDEDLTAHGR
jgi:arylsulfatase A-like enzyme